MIRIDNAVRRESALALGAQVLSDLKVAQGMIEAGEIDARHVLGMEPERKCRTELLLSFTMLADKTDGNKIVTDILQELIGEYGSVRQLYEQMVSEKGTLYDFAALVTEPGSDRQQLHSDMPFHTKPALYSIFVALQDVSMAMGPTVFLPGSITADIQSEFSSLGSRDDFCASQQPYFALLKAGDLVMYDPRVLHCGSANLIAGGSTRMMFNLGFRNPEFVGDMGYEGSIRPDYSGRISLGDITARLQASAGTGTGGQAKYGAYKRKKKTKKGKAAGAQGEAVGEEALVHLGDGLLSG